MLAGGPLAVNLLRACVEIRTGPAHPFDDLAGIDDEQLVGVALVAAVEKRRGRRDRRVKAVGVDVHPVSGAERLVPFAEKRRPGVDQGPVDVEEHGTGHKSLKPQATSLALSRKPQASSPKLAPSPE